MIRGVFFPASAIVIAIVSFVSASPRSDTVPGAVATGRLLSRSLPLPVPYHSISPALAQNPQAVALLFRVDEGKRVRVKEIQFLGDHDGFSQRRLRGAMKLVEEAGMLSNFTSKDIYFER